MLRYLNKVGNGSVFKVIFLKFFESEIFSFFNFFFKCFFRCRSLSSTFSFLFFLELEMVEEKLVRY